LNGKDVLLIGFQKYFFQSLFYHELAIGGRRHFIPIQQVILADGQVPRNPMRELSSVTIDTMAGTSDMSTVFLAAAEDIGSAVVICGGSDRAQVVDRIKSEVPVREATSGN
jgi:hypothetical protein